MDSFCGSKFWDFNETWHSEQPDFTLCFEQTVLVWVPCAFLWLFLAVEIYYMKISLGRNIPYNFWNISKLLIGVGLIVLSMVDICFAALHLSSDKLHPVYLWSPVIKIVSFAAATALVFFNRKFGVRSSGLLFLFWLLLTICSIPRIRTEILLLNKTEDAETTTWNTYQFVSFLIYFSFSCLMLFLNCFADRAPKKLHYEEQTKPCPEIAASFLSRIFFAYFDSMAIMGYRKPLETSHLWDMRYEDSSNFLSPIFLEQWNKAVQKSAEKNQINSQAVYSKKQETLDKLEFSSSKPKSQASIVMPLIKSFGGMFMMGSFLKLFQDVLTFVNPQLLRLIIEFVDYKNTEPMWKGIFYAFLLFIVAAVQTLILGQYFNRMMIVGLRVRTALIAAIYRKSLVISNSARKESTVGEIVNLMAVDAQRFMDLTTYINMLWSAPLQIALALYFLWQILGPSVLAGLAVMIILIPVNGVIANKVKQLQIRQMKNKDERVKLMNEVLNGMKVLKLYAWEPSFEEQVLKIREKEIKVLKEAAYLNAGTSFIWACAPFVVSLVTFATYVLVDPENNVLTASTAFTSVSLFNILRFPLSMLPMLISSLVQTVVSVKRINKFMNADELDPSNVEHNSDDDKTALLIENGTFQWDEQETTLKNVNMKVEKDELVAVVGSVGSGKSSLISAYLGEVDRISGRVNINGNIAFVAQQAWIQNATLKDNILFGTPYDKRRYDMIVKACALVPDFEMLPAGDQTEIGEKGINLSGGQKQRVSLARAVYQNADIYFLDDPLSAVDSHVGKHIFEQVIGPEGLLAGKTRLLVTHGITFLPQVDNIYVMQYGEIIESGSYQTLLAKKGPFADFLLEHLQEASEDEDDLEEIKKQLEQDIGDEDLRKKFGRAISRSRSNSETEGSPKINGAIGRQVSQTSSTDSQGLRKRNSVTPDHKPSEAPNKLIEAEKAETGRVKFEVYKHYLKSVGWSLSIWTILLNVVYQGFTIGSSVWLSKWSTDANSSDITRRNIYLGGYGALGVGQVLSTLASSLTLALGCLYAARQMHNILLHNVLRFPMEKFDTTPLGRMLNRFSKDIDTCDNILPAILRGCLATFFSVIATLCVICISTPIFIAVILPIGILYYFVQRIYVATSRQLKRLESVSRSPIYSHFGESLTGAQTIRAYSVQGRFIKESEKRVDFNQVCYFPSIIANRWLAIRLEMVGNLIILFSALFAVLSKTNDEDNLKAGLVGLSVSYALQITQTLNWLVRMTSDVETNIVAVERIKEYAEEKIEAPWKLENKVVSADWPSNGRVEFDDYQVRYREGLDLVLQGISFVVSGGEKVGIVGRTGAGKSSLTLSLFRIIEAAGGKIVIDGETISELGLHDLRAKLTIIPQDPVLFSGTLRMNLDPFEEKTDDELWKALEHAHLKPFVKGLAAGLNHEISEGGENLSVGQRQLVCLARALLRKTKILILDEATAAVDLETDSLIQKTIRTEFSECTVLTIAHRLNTIMDSDKVLVLDKGKIKEYAPPSDLLKKKDSLFYSMAKDAGLVN